jgi:hypothetical protein
MWKGTTVMYFKEVVVGGGKLLNVKVTCLWGKKISY